MAFRAQEAVLSSNPSPYLHRKIWVDTHKRESARDSGGFRGGGADELSARCLHKKTDSGSSVYF